MTPLYERIGRGYARYRHADPRLHAAILEALGDAASVVNVGAGAGSYEPRDREVVAVEPSATMVAQRPAGAARCVRGTAEALPFRARAFDAALAVLTMHHWADWRAGLAEVRRVSRRRLVVFTWTPLAGAFWLTRDYLPEIFANDRVAFPAIETFTRIAGGDVAVRPVPIPWDCTDGFLGAYWRRPEAYLDPARAGATSALALPTPAVRRALARLADDVASGRWAERYGELLALETLDVGFRLLVVSY